MNYSVHLGMTETRARRTAGLFRTDVYKATLAHLISRLAAEQRTSPLLDRLNTDDSTVILSFGDVKALKCELADYSRLLLDARQKELLSVLDAACKMAIDHKMNLYFFSRDGDPPESLLTDAHDRAIPSESRRPSKGVFRLPGKNRWVLYSDTDGWGAETGDGASWFSKHDNFAPLLPLLELPFSAARQMVAQSGAPAAAVASFPFFALLNCALNWDTDAWVSPALDWLESGFPPSAPMISALRDLSEKRHFAQSIRHRAKTLAKHLDEAMPGRQNGPTGRGT